MVAKKKNWWCDVCLCVCVLHKRPQKLRISYVKKKSEKINFERERRDFVRARIYKNFLLLMYYYISHIKIFIYIYIRLLKSTS